MDLINGEQAAAATTTVAAMGAEVLQTSLAATTTAYGAPLVDTASDDDHLQQHQPGVQDLYYQTSYRVEHVGKYHKPTKRRVTWTFCKRSSGGGALGSSTGSGSSDNHHHHHHDDITFEVVLIWSLRSGKQRIFVNGVEEYFCKRKGASLVEHEWELLPPAPAACCDASSLPEPDTATTATNTTADCTSSNYDPTNSSSNSNNNNNNNNNKNTTSSSNSNITPPWLILHLVAARVKPINTEPSFVLDELLLNNVRFSQLPNQDGEIVHSSPSFNVNDTSTYGVQTLVSLSSAWPAGNPNEHNDDNASSPPLSILDILYPQGIGPEVFPASSSSASPKVLPAKNNAAGSNNNNNTTAATALRNDFRLF